MSMRWIIRLQAITAGVFFAGTLALGTTAQALIIDPIDPRVPYTGSGTPDDPFVVTIHVPGAGGGFQHSINFDLGNDLDFNVTSEVTNIRLFSARIFSNIGDRELISGPTHSHVGLPDLGLPFDYHLHPDGHNQGGGSYTLKLWGTPTPVPAAVYLFGSGLIGLIGLARRKMRA